MKITIKHNSTLVTIDDEGKDVIYTDISIMKVIKETIDELIKLKQ